MRIRRAFTVLALALAAVPALAGNASAGVPQPGVDGPIVVNPEVPPIQWPSGNCQTDCIYDKHISAGLRHASVTLKTTVPAKVTFSATPFFSEGKSDSVTENAASTSHGLTLSLSPSTGYLYELTATDANGKSWTETGNFVTRTKKTTVVLDSVQVLDDSDSTGAGEIWAHSLMGGQEKRLLTNRSISSGQTVGLGGASMSWTADDGYDGREVSVQLADNDCDLFGCGSVLDDWPFSKGNWYFKNGSNDDYDYNTVDFMVGGPNSPGTWTGTAATAIGDNLSFKVNYHVVVTVS
ncbi:hypothetical protein [Motilibacter aurantiacus]|uniref:hypothetical protein n=1 Tax=Motilibacter aurantiacus TaxID=2714955 RepID=UPI00140B6B93|nr:hypothetical protein [Motilibacter aurantiacus]NHC44293.1 hypothetical protein [Motilibacter aurantiacus]